jgi:hypothetical protein
LKGAEKNKKSLTLYDYIILYYGPPDVGVRVLPVRF